mgnify:CR=1 FL=1
MAGKFGFRIGPDFVHPKKELMQKLLQYPTPPLADGLNKFNVMDPRIKPVWNGLHIAGPALTVRVRPGDNLMVHKAISMIQEGDVLVIDTCGCMNYTVLGDLMASSAVRKKAAGIVVDGGIRDVDELRAKKFPVFAKYFTPAVGDKDGPGEINFPICCGGVPVMPGDYIVGDNNGVVVIPPDQLEGILAGTEKKLAYEKKRALEIEQGKIDKPDIEEKLRRFGVID